MGQDAPFKPEPTPPGPSLGNYYDLPAASNPMSDISQAESLRAALRDKGLNVDGPGDWSDDDQPYEPHVTGRKQKVAFTATASSPKRSSHRPPTVYDRPIYDHPTDPISGTKHMGAHQMWTGQKDPNKVANNYGFQRDRGEKRPNPAMNHVWANNQANQALKRARSSGFQYDVNLI